jgi:hypothetical protein
MVRAKIIAYAARATRRLKLLGPRYFAMKIISSWRDEPGDAWRARLVDLIALEGGLRPDPRYQRTASSRPAMFARRCLSHD